MAHHYESPLSSRYASAQMSELFSPYTKFYTWRKVWIALAKAQKEIGLDISDAQIKELEAHIGTIDFDAINKYERKFKHDVMANIHAYGDLCPAARPIIHLGATSCTITDNAELIVFKQAFEFTRNKLLLLIEKLSEKADKYKDMPCLGFTHGQVAQPTTVGKRICLWLQDFLLDLKRLEAQLHDMPLLGIKGATGTQASFLELVEGDHDKVIDLEKKVARLLGFETVLPISGQTYTRKQDIYFLNVLNDIAVSAHKMATDIRLLATMKELSEPFGDTQVGSSAMPYKRNPMKCERVCSIARYVISLAENPTYTAATQWFERTLDDSANRRLCIPEAFLAIDGILQLLVNVTDGLQVHEKRIAKNLERELPFLAIEYMLMKTVQRGADRQEMHELIREHCMAAYKTVEERDCNDLFERISADEKIPLNGADFATITPAQFIGRAPEQVSEFLAQKTDTLPKMPSELVKQISV